MGETRWAGERSLKIDGQKTEHLDNSDDATRTKPAAKDDDREDFKKLLERKKDGKDGKDGKKSKAGAKANKGHQKTAERGAAKSATSAKQAKRLLETKGRPGNPGSPGKPGQAGTFGKQLKDGRLQLGQQAEQHERLGSERNTSRHLSETRVEHRHRKKHRRNVQRDHTHNRADGPVGRAGGADKQVRAGSRGNAGKSAPVAASPDAASASVPITGAEAAGLSSAAGASKAEAAAPGEVDHKRAQVAELARKLVDRAHIGHDASGRQIMLMDLEVPGRGSVRVRLRRRGEGFELRMRPESDELARDLRHEREHFRQSAAEGGVDFTSIEIV